MSNLTCKLPTQNPNRMYETQINYLEVICWLYANHIFDIQQLWKIVEDNHTKLQKHGEKAERGKKSG